MDGDRVAAEFMGRARAFQSALVTDSQVSLIAMHRVRTHAERLSARRSRHPRPFRPEVLVELERECQRVSMDGCLRRLVQRDRKTLHAANIWLIPTMQRAGGWDDGVEENSVAMLNDVMVIDQHGEVSRSTQVMAVCNLHAIARWFARAFKTSQQALMADLLTLVEFAEHSVEEPGCEFKLPTNNGGSWRGHHGRTHPSWGGTDPALQCRTFY